MRSRRYEFALLSLMAVVLTCGMCSAGEFFATKKTADPPAVQLPDVDLSQIATSASAFFKRSERPKRYPPQDIDITGLAVIAESAQQAPQVFKLVKIGADWCTPCRNIDFYLDRNKDKFDVDRVDAEDGAAVAAVEREYGRLPRNAQGELKIPVCLFKTSKGEPMRIDGYVTLEEMQAKLKKWDAQTCDAKATHEELPAGIKVGSVPAKAQIESVLTALEPFFDGGTLTVTYTPREGVVREYVTIQQGPAGLRIPKQTSVTFTLDKKSKQLVGKFNGTPPRVIFGPFERSPQQIELSPDKFAVRIPWAPDPEVAFTK